MKIAERGPTPGAVYFHGSSDPELKKEISRPSVERPFFCCPDLDYSMIYANMDNRVDYEGLEGRQRWKKNKSKVFIYVVSLSPEIKIFDPRDHVDPKIAETWPKFVINKISSYGMAFYEAAWRIRDKAKLLFRGGKLDEEMVARQRREFGEIVDEFNRFIIGRFSEKAGSLTVEDIVTEWCKDLKKAGYHAFAGPEGMDNSRKQYVRTGEAVGIFDMAGLETLCVVPMDYRKCKEILKILGDRDERSEDSYRESYDAVRRFVEEYNSLKR